MIIAIDGYSACGKSTLAKDIAKFYNYLYIDSGSMYRAITYHLLMHNIDLNDSKLVETQLSKITLDFIPSDFPKVLLNKEDITSRIGEPGISEFVSEVAAISSVRKRLVQLQREFAKSKSIVMDGRDIGSVVFPNADVKFFITADLKTRSQRRYQELLSKGIVLSLDIIRDNLIKRDHIDSTRTDSPLVQCEDAYVLDNSNLNREEQTKIAIEIIEKKLQTKN